MARRDGTTGRSQYVSFASDGGERDGMGKHVVAVDVLKVHPGEDVSEEHDDHVGMIWGEGGGRGGKDGHVWRGVWLVEEGVGHEGEPDLLLTAGADGHHTTGGGEWERGVRIGPELPHLGEGPIDVPGVVEL